jgi:hypothetical protein
MWDDLTRAGSLVSWAEELTMASSSDTFVTAASTKEGADNDINAVVYARSMVLLVQEKKDVVDDQGIVVEEENILTKTEGDDAAQGGDEVVTDDVVDEDVDEGKDVVVADKGVNGEVNTSGSGDDVNVEAAVVDEKDGDKETTV